MRLLARFAWMSLGITTFRIHVPYVKVQLETAFEGVLPSIENTHVGDVLVI